MRVIELKYEFSCVPDIEIVRLASGKSIMIELAEFNQNMTSRNAALENTVLIVMKVAVADREVHTFCANPRTVLIGNRSPGKFNIFDHYVISFDHPDSFSLGTGVGCFEMRTPVD